MGGVSTAQESEAATVIDGRYRVVGELGRGGMAAVYEVVEVATRKRLALKQLRTTSPDFDRRRAELRFRREYHSLVKLRHPGIVEVDTYGVDADGPYYTMELLDGADVRDLGILEWRDACGILRDVASALAFVHSRGWIHRDLAPRNIRRTAAGRGKLFDFGLLATVGNAGEVAGTPTCIAPENKRGLPLDDRTDLYGLGVLGYWMITGRYPYPVRKLADLDSAWREPPLPITSIKADVPRAVEDLVMALMCLDPPGRPASAAEVVDRLQAVAELEPDPALALSAGYLASAAMVGRQREMEVLKSCIESAARGEGRAVFIEAQSGTGKSRLLKEAGLEATLGGLTVLNAECASSRWGPYEVVHELVRHAIETVPDAAARVDVGTASVVARVFPDLRGRLGPTTRIESVIEPAEERMRIQRAMTQWLAALAGGRPLAILIDDVQRCDEASAAVLAAVARTVADHGVFLVAALRTDEQVRAPKAVAALRTADLRLGLRGLEPDDVAALSRSLFGDVPHATRLAAWMHEVSGGSPLHCNELARALVENGTIRFADGMWIVPMDVGAEGTPARLQEAMDARIAGLGDGARALAAVLSLLGREVELSSCIALVGQDDESEVFSALDELVRKAVLVGDGERYRFRHDGLREAVQRTLDPQQEQMLHLEIGRHLLSLPDAGHKDAEIGWHLHAAGREREGAQYLAAAGRRLFEVQALTDCVAPLETAYDTLERLGAPLVERLDLGFKLVAAGWISNRQVGLRHMHAAAAAYRDYSGVSTAERLHRYIGRHAALIVGVLWACLRWVARPRAVRGPNPIAALTTFAVTVGYACGLEYANHSLEGLQRLIDLTRPLAVFKGRLVYATHLGLTAFPDLLMGKLDAARHKLDHVLSIIANDRLTPVTDFERRFANAGVRSLVGQIQVTNLDPALDDTIDAMKNSGLRYYALVAGTFETSALRFRGREREAAALERELEAASIQLGSWSTDVQLVLFGHPPYGLCGDLLNLKRMVDALEDLVDQGFDYHARLALTRGDYLRVRGDIDQARAAYARALELLPASEALTRQWVLAGLAEAHLDAGDFTRARQVGERCLQLATDAATAQASVELRAQRVLGLAQALGGQLDEGCQRIEEAIVRAEPLETAVGVGLLHEARARIALAQEDHATFYLHAGDAANWLRPTGNPALIQVVERLHEAASSSRSDSHRIPAHELGDSTTADTKVTTQDPSHSSADPRSGAS